ncbi:hypothetical protein KG091_01075 [Carnobacteriaceae bacterium zg-ZUI78]|nr:hypothetical protein [Carnobacteriaceae bacterium zg-ZUI78]
MRISKYIDQLNQKNIPIYLKERISLAKLIVLHNDISFMPRRSVPYYLNDLGVREFKSIQKMMLTVCHDNCIKIPTTHELVEELACIPIQKYAYWIDMVIFLTGDYQAVEISVLNRFDEIVAYADYTLCIFSGTVLVARNNKKGLQLFELASNINVSKSTLNRLTALHRMAVSELKRFRNFKKVESILNEIVLENHSNIQDDLMMTVLVNNLYAFFLLESHREMWGSLYIELIMKNAQLLSKALLYSKDISDNKKHQVARYLSQININLAQIFLKKEQLKRAIYLLELNVDMVSKYATVYISEALGTLGYFLNKDFKRAIPILEQALVYHVNEGEFYSIVFDYQLLIVLYYKTDNMMKVRELEKELVKLEQSDSKRGIYD